MLSFQFLTRQIPNQDIMSSHLHIVPLTHFQCVIFSDECELLVLSGCRWVLLFALFSVEDAVSVGNMLKCCSHNKCLICLLKTDTSYVT